MTSIYGTVNGEDLYLGVSSGRFPVDGDEVEFRSDLKLPIWNIYCYISMNGACM